MLLCKAPLLHGLKQMHLNQRPKQRRGQPESRLLWRRPFFKARHPPTHTCFLPTNGLGFVSQGFRGNFVSGGIFPRFKVSRGNFPRDGCNRGNFLAGNSRALNNPAGCLESRKFPAANSRGLNNPAGISRGFGCNRGNFPREIPALRTIPREFPAG